MSENGTNIDDLLNNVTSLSSDENNMVDSIINELNTNDNNMHSNNTPVSTQSQMPQISEEDKQLLIQQQ